MQEVFEIGGMVLVDITNAGDKVRQKLPDLVMVMLDLPGGFDEFPID